jgi:hypothetical protein
VRNRVLAAVYLLTGCVLGWLLMPTLAAQSGQLVRMASVEDAVAGSGWNGVGLLAVRQDSHSDLAADGDFIPVTVDADGGLRVSIVAGAGSGGTAAADDADFTDGTTSGTPIGGVAEDAAPTTVTEGDFGWAAITLNRALKVTLYDSDGAELTPSEDQTLDAAIGTTGPLMTGRGSTATPSAMSADGDTTAIWLDLNGRLHLAAEGKEDEAETAGGFLAMAGSVRRDAAAASAGTTGDNATINTDALGLLWARFLDPCSGVAKTTIPIDIVTATTTEITAALAGASTHYYVCAVNLVTADDNNVALVDDDSDNCGSVTSGLAGGTTAGEGWNLSANGGLTLGNGLGTVAKTNGTNRVLCLVTSAGVQLSGTIVVAAAP